jgi:hypothetical protein
VKKTVGMVTLKIKIFDIEKSINVSVIQTTGVEIITKKSNRGII